MTRFLFRSLISSVFWSVVIFAPESLASCPPPASSGTCGPYCETGTALSTAASTAKKTLEAKVKKAELAIDLKIKDTDEANTQAIVAATSSATNDTAFVTKQIAGFHDATNQVNLDFLKANEAYVTSRDLMPTISECIDITNKRGVIEGRLIQTAALKSMTRESVDTFQQVAGIRDTEGKVRPYSRGAAVRVLYDDWQKKYCVESSNNGYAGDIDGGCGAARDPADDVLEDLDIKVADILFNKQTIPREDILDAKKNLIYYLGAKPVTPPPPREYSNPQTQAGVIAFRGVSAKKNLADSAFDYLTSKRLPVIPAGQAKAVLQRDIQASSHLNSMVESIGDEISFAQWLDIFMSKRFFGTDYFTTINKMNESQLNKEVNNLLSMRLVQQRERYLMLERLLALVAADYALEVDATSSRGSVVSSSQ